VSDVVSLIETKRSHEERGNDMNGTAKKTRWFSMVRAASAMVFAVVLVIGLVSVALSAEQPTAKEQDTIEQLRSMAEKGSAEAQTKLADLYKEGKKVTQDLQESAKWYTKAAEKGFAEAQFKLGELYVEGKGVVQNYKEGISWLRKSADQGYDAAKQKLQEIASKAHEAMEDLKKVPEKK
jgi:TPR repeat protein